MRPPVPRFVRWAVALAVMAALTLVVFQYWGSSQYGTAALRAGQASPAPGQNTDWKPTRWGPLGPADRNLLIMIRQAGLTAVPSGQQAQRQGSNPQVRTIAKTIWTDCSALESQVRSVAGKLGVALPAAPTAQQQGWMKELSRQTGSAYDRMFTQGLRLTEGAVAPAITSVRAGTRNELIRSLATTAATVLNRHMDVLERTGLVDYAKLPAPAPSTPALGPAVSSSGQRIAQVANATAVVAGGSGIDANAMVAALVSVAGLLIALGLLGSTGRRFRKPATVAQHRPQQRRHAAHRW